MENMSNTWRKKKVNMEAYQTLEGLLKQHFEERWLMSTLASFSGHVRVNMITVSVSEQENSEEERVFLIISEIFLRKIKKYSFVSEPEFLNPCISTQRETLYFI